LFEFEWSGLLIAPPISALALRDEARDELADLFRNLREDALLIYKPPCEFFTSVAVKVPLG
jgi:hypothetical protein